MANDFLSGFYEQYAGARPKGAYLTAKQAIKRGVQDPDNAMKEFMAKGQASGWKSRKLERFGRKLRKTPYGFEPTERYASYEPILAGAYADLLGRLATPEELEQNYRRLSAARVSSSDPGAVESFVTNQLLSSREGLDKIKTPEDIAWERQYGPMGRDEQGYLRRGMLRYDPAAVESLGNLLFSV